MTFQQFDSTLAHTHSALWLNHTRGKVSLKVSKQKRMMFRFFGVKSTNIIPTPLALAFET